MKRSSKRSVTDRLIHIRIDEETYHKLKVHAALSKATIQELVENLIRSRYQNIKIGDTKP
jgi:hypothetical protein